LSFSGISVSILALPFLHPLLYSTLGPALGKGRISSGVVILSWTWESTYKKKKCLNSNILGI